LQITRRTLLWFQRRAQASDTMADDLLVRLLLLCFNPSSMWHYGIDIHALMDLGIATLLGARTTLPMTEERHRTFGWCCGFFGILRITMSLSMHIEEVITEVATAMGRGQEEKQCQSALYYISTSIRSFIWLLGISSVLQWCFDMDCSHLFTAMGTSGLVVGFAVQSTLKDVAASMTIFLEGYFQVSLPRESISLIHPTLTQAVTVFVCVWVAPPCLHTLKLPMCLYARPL